MVLHLVEAPSTRLLCTIFHWRLAQGRLLLLSSFFFFFLFYPNGRNYNFDSFLTNELGQTSSNPLRRWWLSAALLPQMSPTLQPAPLGQPAKRWAARAQGRQPAIWRRSQPSVCVNFSRLLFCPTAHKPLATGHRPPFTVHRSPSTIDHRLSCSVFGASQFHMHHYDNHTPQFPPRPLSLDLWPKILPLAGHFLDGSQKEQRPP